MRVRELKWRVGNSAAKVGGSGDCAAWNPVRATPARLPVKTGDGSVYYSLTVHLGPKIFLLEGRRMDAGDVPAGFSGPHFYEALGQPVEFCIRHDVQGHGINITADQRGVGLKVQECEFRAIAEFKKRFFSYGEFANPARWHVGFVQNLTEGAIIFHYKGDQADDTGVFASIAPRTLPCKDSGSAGTWYDPSPFSVKRFGGKDEFADMIEPALPVQHPALTNERVRYVRMGDAPGTGNLPLTMPCQSSIDVRAAARNDYTIGWFDPLNPNASDPRRRPLFRIEGSLSFKTCLAMSPEPNPSWQAVKITTLFEYLYYVDWTVHYAMNVRGQMVTPRHAVAEVTAEGVWENGMAKPIVVAPDANESVCVRFI
jgi:hypothetical protein